MSDVETRNERIESEQRTGPVLLYDAKCDICSELAVKVRQYSGGDVSLVALSDPEAGRILDQFYQDGWTHDFYVVEGDTCRKGARALPMLRRHVGVRKLGSLIGEYASYKRNQGTCDHGEAGQDDGLSLGVSRRSALSGLSTAAFATAAPLSGLAGATGADASTNPKVHVATVRRTDDGFAVSVERRPDLEQPSQSTGKRNNGATLDSSNGKVLRKQDVGPNSSVEVGRSDLEFSVSDADAIDPELHETIRQHPTTERYDVMVEHSRFGNSLNVGTGPVVRDGEGSLETHLTGRSQHDVVHPSVDFVTFDGSVHASTQLEGYVHGITALQDLHAEAGRNKLATIYGDVAEFQRTVHENFSAAVDTSDLVPTRNHVLISGLPTPLDSVRAPEDGDDVVGFGCGCNCGWGCCCGCGCGCGFPCSCGCGCCCSCGYACTCGCCI